MPRIRRLPCLCTALLLLLALGGCATTPAPEKALDRMLDSLQRGSMRAAESLTVDGTLNIARAGRNAEKIYAPLFASIAYKVTGSQTSGDSATVTVTISAADLEALTTEVSAALMREVLAQNLSDRQASALYYQLLLERLEDDDKPACSSTVSVRMQRVDGNWRVDMAASPDFADAITGGVRSIIGY